MTECPAAADAPEAEAPEPPRRPALSPSRAADFKQCPAALPLPGHRPAARAPLPRPGARHRSSTPCWSGSSTCPPLNACPRPPTPWSGPSGHGCSEDVPELLDALFAGPGDPALAEWLASAEPLLDTYFRLEDPRRLEPAARELLVETELDSGLLLRGYVDRLDIAATGQVRIVDYKTGAAPRPVAEARALFQMKFYALVLLHLRGVVPAQLRLLYLTDGESLTYEPGRGASCCRFARTLEAIWAAILRARPPTATSGPTPAASASGAATGRCARHGAASRPPTPAGRATRPRRRPPTAPGEGPWVGSSDQRVSEPFYLPLDGPDGERFHATVATTGPWFADAQHAGPPTALLVRALERCAPQPRRPRSAGSRSRCSARSRRARSPCARRVERPGRSVELLAAELAAGGRVVLRARAWRLAGGDTAAVATSPADGAAAPLPPPAEAPPAHRAPAGLAARLHRRAGVALAARLAGRSRARARCGPGSGCRWSPTRSRRPLQRLMLVADSGNGAAAPLDIREWLFVNTELTIHLHRPPDRRVDGRRRADDRRPLRRGHRGGPAVRRARSDRPLGPVPHRAQAPGLTVSVPCRRPPGRSGSPRSGWRARRCSRARP